MGYFDVEIGVDVLGHVKNIKITILFFMWIVKKLGIYEL